MKKNTRLIISLKITRKLLSCETMKLKTAIKRTRKVLENELRISDIPAIWRAKGFDDCSEEYPLGGSLEPYDIEREKELLK
jgi:hypothetical protein